jgi:hypothetical protein
MESGSLWITTKNVWNSRETMLENNVTDVSVPLCLRLVQEYCLYFLNYLRT